MAPVRAATSRALDAPRLSAPMPETMPVIWDWFSVSALRPLTAPAASWVLVRVRAPVKAAPPANW